MDKMADIKQRFPDVKIEGWTYQFVTFVDDNDEQEIVLCEIYYDKARKPILYCEAEIVADSINEMHEVFDRILKCFNKEVLDGNIFSDN